MMRLYAEQSLHDLVVSRIAVAERQKGLTVWTNPGQEKNYSVTVGGTKVWPDVMSGSGSNIEYVFEVETAGTLTEDHAAHWVPYSKVCSNFILAVPKQTAGTAQNILVQLGISAAILHY